MSKQSTPSVTRRDDHNNPVWAVEASVEIIRMDNSLSLTEHMGEFRTKGSTGKIMGTISRAIGGFVFMVTDAKTHQRLAIDCKGLVEKVFADRKLYEAATHMSHPKSRVGDTAKPKRRRRA